MFIDNYKLNEHMERKFFDNEKYNDNKLTVTWILKRESFAKLCWYEELTKKRPN